MLYPCKEGHRCSDLDAILQLTTTEARELAWEKLRSWREYRRRVKLELRSKDFDCEKSARVWRSWRSSYAFSDLDSGRLGPALQNTTQHMGFHMLLSRARAWVQGSMMSHYVARLMH